MSTAGTAIREIEIDSIDPSPYQTRRFTRGAGSLEELAESIGRLGVLEPILVRPREGDRFELLAGERRTRASRIAGAATVPAIVRDLDDDQAMDVTVSENLHREDLHPLDEAAAIAMLMQRHGDLAEVAARLGRTESFVARRARLNTLSEAWRGAIERCSSPVAGVCMYCGCTDDDKTMCDECGPALDLSGWGVTHLDVVARLETADQDGLLQQLRVELRWMEGMPTVRDIEEFAGEYLRRLDRAPWALDDGGVLPDAGPCTKCPKRAGANPGLFDEIDESATGKGTIPAGDRCLSAACWDRKLAAHVRIQKARIQEDTGERPISITIGGSSEEGAVDARRVNISDEPKRGYKPAVRIDGPGAGQVVYARDRKSGSPSRSAKPEKGQPLTMEEKRERLRRRRYSRAITLAHGALLETEKLPHESALLVLAATIGTQHSASYGPNQPWFRDWHLEGQPKGTIAELLEDGDEIQLQRVLWQTLIRPLVIKRTEYQSRVDIDAAWTELCAIAELVDVDLAPLMEVAIEELPEPKSWGEAA